jgi:hypothetical protein
MADSGSRPESTPFREHLPDLSIDRFTTMQKLNAHEYGEGFKQHGQPPWLHALYMHWQQLLAEPFKGVTSDGKSLTFYPSGN